MRGGRRRGLATVLGIQTGLLLWITAAVLGLAALLRASEVAYTVLHIVGAGYLVWLGVQSLRARGVRSDERTPRRSPLGGTGYWTSSRGTAPLALLTGAFRVDWCAITHH